MCHLEESRSYDNKEDEEEESRLLYMDDDVTMKRRTQQERSVADAIDPNIWMIECKVG